MKVSVVIVSYKGLDFIKNCSLASVLNQTYKNLEILIFNDGEDSDLRNYLESLNDDRIQFFEFDRPNYKKEEIWAVGGGKNRNRSLDILTGDLIVPLDQDDILASDMIEKRVNFFKNNPDKKFTYSKCINVGDNKIRHILGAQIDSTAINLYKKRTGHNYIPHCTVCYVNELKKYKYNDEGTLAGDYALWCRLLDNKIELTFIDEVQSIRNGKNNSFEVLKELYEKEFNTPWVDINNN